MVLLVGGGSLARSMASVVGGASLTAWPTAAIAICTVALCPPIAQAADFWGRKWFLVALGVIGCAGSIIISRATSMGMAITGFVIGGIAFGVGPLLIAVVSEVLPRKYRSWAQATVNATVGIGAVFALLVGGKLVQTNPAGFRTYFYIAAGVYAASGLACALLYNPPTRETQKQSTRQKLRQLDGAGYLLLASGLSLFCLGLSWAQNPYPWHDAHVLGPLLAGIVLIFALVGYEWKFEKNGLFNHDLFRDRNFPIALVSIFIEGFGTLGVNYFLPFQLTVMYPTMGTYRITLCYSIVYYAFLVFLFVSGLYIWKFNSVRGPIMAGNAAFLLFFILMATVKTDAPQANFWGFATIFGSGLATLLVSLVVAAQLSTPPELIAITSGLLVSVRSLGGSISLAVLNAIMNHSISQNLAPKVAAAVIPLGLSPKSLGPLLKALAAEDQAALLKIPGITRAIIGAAAAAVQDAYCLSFSYVYATAGTFAFVGLVGRSHQLLLSAYGSLSFCASWLTEFASVAAFFRNPKAEFTSKIDAPLDIVYESGNEKVTRE